MQFKKNNNFGFDLHEKKREEKKRTKYEKNVRKAPKSI